MVSEYLEGELWKEKEMCFDLIELDSGPVAQYHLCSEPFQSSSHNI